MLNIIIFGPPGSGKGTQSAKIVENYNLIHISTGDLMREEIANDTALGREVKKYIDKGMLVPDEIIMRELYEKASKHLDAPGLIFDGFPRTIVQAEMLDQMLEEHDMPIDVVLSVDVNEEELFKRLMGRGEDSGRSDDKTDIIWRRIEVYKEQTMPLIDFYKKQGKIVSINGMSPVDQVFGKIIKAVDTYLETREIIPAIE